VAVLVPSVEVDRLIDLLNDAYNNMMWALEQRDLAQKRLYAIKLNINRTGDWLRQRYPKLARQIQLASDKYQHAAKTYNMSRIEFFRQKQQFDKDIVNLAGVPPKYQYNILVEIDSKGNIHISFGGNGKPHGTNHGHYVIGQTYIMPYRREWGEPHGPQNYRPKPRDYNTNTPDLNYAAQM